MASEGPKSSAYLRIVDGKFGEPDEQRCTAIVLGKPTLPRQELTEERVSSARLANQGRRRKRSEFL